jgi:hypothetical protein
MMIPMSGSLFFSVSLRQMKSEWWLAKVKTTTWITLRRSNYIDRLRPDFRLCRPVLRLLGRPRW